MVSSATWGDAGRDMHAFRSRIGRRKRAINTSLVWLHRLEKAGIYRHVRTAVFEFHTEMCCFICIHIVSVDTGVLDSYLIYSF